MPAFSFLWTLPFKKWKKIFWRFTSPTIDFIACFHVFTNSSPALFKCFKIQHKLKHVKIQTPYVLSMILRHKEKWIQFSQKKFKCPLFRFCEPYHSKNEKKYFEGLLPQPLILLRVFMFLQIHHQHCLNASKFNINWKT